MCPSSEAASLLLPAPGIPITSTTSPSPATARRGSRTTGATRRAAAATIARVASGVRAPGIATMHGDRASSEASASSTPIVERRARRGPPSGEWAISVSPRSSQRSSTPLRRALSSNALSAFSTAEIGASASASSSCTRFTFETPTRRTRPSSTSFASARSVVRQGTRGSGACTRYRSMPTPPRTSRLVSQSARSVRARPSATQRPAGLLIPPFVTTRTLRPTSARASSRSLSPYARAVSKTVAPASAAATTVASACSSSTSPEVERRMQPSPTLGSDGESQPLIAPTLDVSVRPGCSPPVHPFVRRTAE